MRIDRLHGLIAVDKPSGYTSNDVASYLRKYMTWLLYTDLHASNKRKHPPSNFPTLSTDLLPISHPNHPSKSSKKKFQKWPPEAKAGQAGTLDPMATGVLIIGIGKSTKSLNYFLTCGRKTYVATGQFGSSTDTFDSTGSTLVSLPFHHISQSTIEALLIEKFTGVISQVPPVYSALKVGGKKLCDMARDSEKKGEKVDIHIRARQVTIHEIKLLNTFDSNVGEFKISVTCSSGTYIRSIIHDIGQLLGSCAHMTALVRTRQGPFMLNTNTNNNNNDDGDDGNYDKDGGCEFDEEENIPVLKVEDLTDYEKLVENLENEKYLGIIDRYISLAKIQMHEKNNSKNDQLQDENMVDQDDLGESTTTTTPSLKREIENDSLSVIYPESNEKKLKITPS